MKSTRARINHTLLALLTAVSLAMAVIIAGHHDAAEHLVHTLANLTPIEAKTIEKELTKAAAKTSSQEHSINTKLNIGNITAYVTIYKNGEKILEEKDIATTTLIKQLAYLILRGRIHGYQFDMSVTNYIISIDNGKLYIEIGSATQPETPSVTSLASPIAKLEIEEYNLENTNDKHIITVAATWIASQPATIREVGLSNTWGLLFYHVLSAPVQLNTNESITIKYTIIITKSLPFTENFWNLVTAYVFCSETYGYALSIVDVNGVIDNHVDLSDYADDDARHSYVYLATSIARLQDNLPTSVYGFQSVPTRVTKVDVIESNKLVIHIYGTHTAGANKEVLKGVVVSIKLDFNENAGGRWTGVRLDIHDVVVAYVPFSNPVELQPWQGMGFHIVLELNAS